MINWSQVAELRSEVGAEDFEEVLDIFFEEVEEITGRLADRAEPAHLGDDLHFLKGSALNLGFSAFSAACQTGETLCANGEAAQVNLFEILTTYAGSKEAFIAGLPEAFP